MSETTAKKHPNVGRYVGMLHRCSRKHFEAAMVPIGIPARTFPFLMRLYREEDVSQDELAHFYHFDKATVARALVSLEEAGLVTRVPDAEDRRFNRVRLTPKACDIEPQLRAILDNWSRTLTDGFTREEQEAALDLLSRMAENARQAVDDSRA
ncbi:MAG: hypothetical protein AUJ92_18605 [Armatimonadetes bacterium CG2_30_59_28]|nr:winged helix-turn-helix transcriptional regulator [Armatimonadota bacterium]OIO90528.1 MAG: hypothetical protein AUJ92_18605 [Armatimonadetes bacterium CG2_30_59_28]PIU64732.1 MAG: hypothetical protein COS85_11425 [Armatimonadetes bacterium CG07_land_8_20_14_0_80_59_28]PIX39480.1 MAG: hypothetical protein COZ56_17385 [Armatimonadetes bacterium CG_4_8_14_3_um_filter_58_9]PIY39945.1 MAG: hypothetical protein COZ05_18420 [Armatimonadetes bacterium CG_4_10_14_3_um_filter_59_10]PJB70403.1 MAG: h